MVEAEEVKAFKCPSCGVIIEYPKHSQELALIDRLKEQITKLRKKLEKNNAETLKRDVKLHEMKVIMSQMGVDPEDAELVEKYSQRRVSKGGEEGLKEQLFRREKQVCDLKKNIKAVQRRLSRYEE